MNSIYALWCVYFSTIADIGSGTGILTQQLIHECSKVYAIEPNSDMRRVAEKRLRNEPGFISINGTAENTTLENESIDYITAAQSFHWFDSKRKILLRCP